MPVPPRPISPQVMAEGRRLYEETRVAVDDIAAMMGISSRSFFTRVRKWGWRRRIDRIPQLDPPREAADAVTGNQPVVPVEAAPLHLASRAEGVSPVPPDSGSLAARIQRAVERELFAIEQIVAKLRPASEHTEEAERAARVLASLARTLQEIAKLDRKPDPAKDDVKDDDRGPDDPDEFLFELARRMDAFSGRRANPVPDVAAREDA